nr:MAG TPA: hypothetical protein [Siphoviridae sp. ctHdl3]DAV61820.1 MAG TPA: hypothetical protein [Caudoviricetes sp.]
MNGLAAVENAAGFSLYTLLYTRTRIISIVLHSIPE